MKTLPPIILERAWKLPKKGQKRVGLGVSYERSVERLFNSPFSINWLNGEVSGGIAVIPIGELW